MTWEVEDEKVTRSRRKSFVLDNGFSHLFFGGKKIEPSLVHTGCGVPALKLPASWGCLAFHFSQVSSCIFFSAGLWVLEHWEPGLVCLNMPHIQQRHARSKSNSCIIHHRMPWATPGAISGLFDVPSSSPCKVGAVAVPTLQIGGTGVPQEDQSQDRRRSSLVPESTLSTTDFSQAKKLSE